MSDIANNMRELLQAADWRFDGADIGADAGLVDTITRWIPLEEMGLSVGQMFEALDWLKTHADPSIEDANETITDPVASGKVRGGTWRYAPRRAYLDREGEKKKIGLYQPLVRDGGAGTSGAGVEIGSTEDFSKRLDWATAKGQAAADSQVTFPLTQGQIDTKTAEKDPKTGLWNNRLDRKKPKDQVISSVEVSPSGITNTLVHTEASVALGTPTLASGHILVNKNKPTDAGNNETTAIDEQPSDQTAVSKHTTASEIAITVSHTEGPEITNFAPAAGHARVVEQAPTKAGNKRSADTDKEPVALDTGWISFVTYGGTGYVRTFENIPLATLTTIKADCTNGMHNNVSVRKDSVFGLYTGSITRSPRPPSGGSGPAVQDQYTYLNVPVFGPWLFRRIDESTETEKIFTDQKRRIEYRLSGGFTTSGEFAWGKLVGGVYCNSVWGSTVVKVGAELYQWRLCTVHSEGAWVKDT